MSLLPISPGLQRFVQWVKKPVPTTQALALLFLPCVAAGAAWLPPQTRHALAAHLPLGAHFPAVALPSATSAQRVLSPLALPSAENANAPTARTLVYQRATDTARVRLASIADLTLTVNSTSDAPDATPGDKACRSSAATGAACTLRAAIQEANASGGATINFNIPGSTAQNPVVQTIALASPLPAITTPVVINGTSEPGSAVNTLAGGDNAKITVQINAAGATGASAALSLTAGSGGSTIKGLAIGGTPATGAAILVSGSDGDTIAGNFLGTDASGQAALANGGAGVFIQASSNTIVGGATVAARNLISGNGSSVNPSVVFGIVHFPGVYLAGGGAGNTVTNNFIGTNVAGTQALANGGSGVQIYSLNPDKTATTATVITNNLLSGNALYGAAIAGPQTSGTVVQGNKIGTDVSGTFAIANGTNTANTTGGGGVVLSIASNSGANTIGGASAGQGNLISGNVGIGIYEISGNCNIQNNLIGTDITGLKIIPGSLVGINIDFSRYDTVQGNTIAGATQAGIVVTGQTALGNKIQGNRIGVGVDGTTPLPNPGYGILISSYAASNIIGDPVPATTSGSGGPTNSGLANIIANNGLAGISLQPSFVSGNPQQNSILGNSINNNGGLGIDLGNFGAPRLNGNDPNGPNILLHYPVLSSATVAGNSVTIAGTLNSGANSTYRIEFFSDAVADPSGYGEGQTFLGFQYVTTDGNGNASFSTKLPYSGTNGVFSATATDKYGDTSEFSADYPPGPSAAGACSTGVTNTNDGGTGSLRAAILCADVSTSPSAVPISFNIPGTGVHTISPLSPLPAITHQVTLDGYSQPGSSANTLATGNNAKLEIELDGANISATTDNNGLLLFAGSDGSTVRGLVINRFKDNGLLAQGVFNGYSQQGVSETDYFGLTNVTVAGCFFGTDATGTLARGNGTGALVTTGGTFFVGGPAPADRNLFSGNLTDGLFVKSPINAPAIPNLDCVVSGNYIGTNAQGDAAVPNQTFGTEGGFHTNNNVISGNKTAGISLSGGNFQNNLIGTNAQGTSAVPNGIGIEVLFGVGTGTAANNVIAGNTGDGIQLNGSQGGFFDGNFIGVTRQGNALGNGGDGIDALASLTFIGNASSNTIAFNAGNGVTVGANASLVIIGTNSIYNNGKLGIDVGNDGVTPNQTSQGGGVSDPQNFPVIVKATTGAQTVDVTLNSAPSQSFTVRIFANASPDPSLHGEGQTFIGSGNVTTDANGNTGTVSIALNAPIPADTVLSATATLLNSSEFSADFTPSPTGGAPTVGLPGFGVSLKPAGPTTNQTVTATPVFATPPSGLKFAYNFSVNGVSVQNGASNKLDLSKSGFGDKGQTVSVVLTATSSTSSATATNSVKVVNSAPVTTSVSGKASESQTISIPVNASDADGDALTFKSVGGPTNGVGGFVTTGGKTNFVYTSRARFNGTETIRFVALDGHRQTLEYRHDFSCRERDAAHHRAGRFADALRPKNQRHIDSHAGDYRCQRHHVFLRVERQRRGNSQRNEQHARFEQAGQRRPKRHRQRDGHCQTWH